MKWMGKIAVCVAGGLALHAGLRADELAMVSNSSSDNPYATIAARNVFGLVPPPPPEDPAKDAEKNLPKITATGIQSFFGYPQVLFKVTPVRAGSQPKEEYYTLSEGQRQDDITVVKIDEAKSLVTFDNHGTTQELPLASAPNSGGPAAASAPSGAMNSSMVSSSGRGGNNGGGGIIRFGGVSGGNSGGPGNASSGFNNGGNNPNPGLGANNSLQSHIYQPETTPLTREAVEIQLAGNHLKAQQDNDPTAPFYPSTVIDKEVGINPSGN